jgi:CRP-like cAMP-binding protein
VIQPNGEASRASNACHHWTLRPERSDVLSYSQFSATKNHLLASLPVPDYERILSLCKTVKLDLSEILNLPGSPIAHVYFPLNSFISLIASVDVKSRLEVGMVGNEGMLGIPLFLGESISPLLAQVQGEGWALQISASQFLRSLSQSTALQLLLRRYVHVQMAQLAQNIACVRFHVVEERLARWLLMSHDRAHADEFHVTQVFLSHMLGVRRVGITNAASALQNKQLIHYHRGRLSIIDRAGLEAASCSCYQVDTATYQRGLG